MNYEFSFWILYPKTHSGFLLIRNFKCANKPSQLVFIVTNIGKINFFTLFLVKYL